MFDQRVEIITLLVLFFFASVVTVGTYHLRWGKLPVAIGGHSTRAERFVASTLVALVALTFVLGGLYLFDPRVLDRVHGYAALESDRVRAAGFLLAVASFGLIFWAQATMGESWRIGIDRARPQSLVEHGPFRWIRNPIYSGMMGGAVGTFLIVPCDVTGYLAALAIFALHVQARLEEDFLLDQHGDAYRVYLARTGRFAPSLGGRAR